MKPRKLLAGICFLTVLTSAAQNPEWIVYNTSNSGLGDNDIRALSIDNNGVKWVGTINDAVSSFNGTFWNHYNSVNSYVFDDYILCISTDSQNNKWIGTRSGGMSKFDGTQWYFWDETHSDIPDDKVSDIQFEGAYTWVGTMHGLARFDGNSEWVVYDLSNSAIPAEEVRGIAIDGSGNIWIATWGGGIARFDGTSWTSYTTANSPISSDYCISLYYDGQYFWVGTSLAGLVRFDGTNWEIYTDQNSGLPNKTVFSTKKEGNKRWFATGGGLAMLEGTNWTVFNTTNSGLPGQVVKDIEIDGSGNKWIATDQGLAVYRQGGVLSSGGDEVASAFDVKIYPDPCQDETTLQWNIPGNNRIRIEVFNSLGERVCSVPSFSSQSGVHSMNIQLSGLSSGIYFCRISTANAFVMKKFIKK